MTSGKTTALTIWNFVGKVMSLLFNTLSRFVTAVLPRSKQGNYIHTLSGCVGTWLQRAGSSLHHMGSFIAAVDSSGGTWALGCRLISSGKWA